MRSLKCLKCRKEMSHSEAKYGLHPQCFSIWFNANSHDEFEGLARKDSLSSADPSIQNSERWNSSFFHGKFLKYAADLAGISYIIKLQDESAPELPYVEYLSNQIAESLGIKIAPFYCINFHEKPAFVTRNLIDKNSNLKSLVHIYHYIPSPKDYNCESLIKIIYEQTNTLREIDSFIQICLFDSLVGNHDRHGRNLGLIVDSNEKYLCPAYDNPSALGLENGDILRAQFSPRGKITTKDQDEPTIKHYVTEFRRLGYDETVAKFYKKINPKKIDLLIKNSQCTDLMKDALLRLIRIRYEEISDALQS